MITETTSNNPSYVQNFHKSITSPQNYRHLVGDIHTSTLSLGAAPLGMSTDLKNPAEFVTSAIQDYHVNYIDTAPWYGQGKSESILGEILQNIPRKAYFIATKVGRYELDLKHRFDFSRKKTMESVNKSLKLLKVDCIDVVQVHDCEFSLDDYKMILEECLPALQELKDEGKIRFIGITGYPISMFTEVISRSNVKIDTILSYCKLSIHDYELLNLRKNDKFKNIGIIAASPLSMGLLTPNGPPDWHPADKELKEVSRKAAEICKKNTCNFARLAIRFSVERFDFNATLLVGVRNLEEVKMNFDNTCLSIKENQVLNQVLKVFEEAGCNQSWERKEVQSYKNFMLTGKLNSDLQ